MPLVNTSILVRSSLAVRDNAVKNVIFKAASILLQFAVAKIFAFATFKLRDYTSFIMFSEPLSQKIFYAVSRRMNSRALLVLAFAVVTVLVGLYDTLLWALDSPGYITQRATSHGSGIILNLVQNPSYILFIGNPSQRLDDINIEEDISSNLFKPGFNFTLQAVTDISRKQIVPSRGNISETGARIWLDDTGFSVGVEQDYTTTPTSVGCPVAAITENSFGWNCRFNNSEGLTILNKAMGQVQIWWDETNTEMMYLDRKDNPWVELSTGGDTAVMKQVFTVTRGKKRHTFLETVFKVSMVTRKPPFDVADITDVIKRTWQEDPTQDVDSSTQLYIDMVQRAQQANGTSLSFGANYAIPSATSVHAATIEYLNVYSPNYLYTVFRTGTVNITLISSEDLDEAPTPFVDCDASSTNLASGGRVRSSTCYKSFTPTPDNTFKGQLDTSSIAIFSDIIGDGTSSKAAVAFNQSGYDWLLKQEGRIDDVLIARGVLVGGNMNIVDVTVRHDVPAISYLQLILSLLPLILAFVAWLLTALSPMSYYQQSFLAALVTTTHISPSETCTKVQALRNPPELSLAQLVDNHTVIQTPSGGILGHLTPPYPFTLSPGSSSFPTPMKEETQVLMEPPDATLL